MQRGFVTFFFSSRRRHTRSYGDWSSDVCSSDLLSHVLREVAPLPVLVFLHEGLGSIRQWRDFPQNVAQALGCREIGRASCRETGFMAEAPRVPETRDRAPATIAVAHKRQGHSLL